MCIYKIYNTINDKLYIGQTIFDAEKRFREHKGRANRGVKGRLYNAMRKHGIENFYIEPIEEIEATDDYQDVLNDREKYWIQFYNSVNRGYNVTYGGDSNPMHSNEGRKRHLDSVRSEEVRLSVSKSMKKYREEHPFTEEHRKKISMALRGNHNFGSGDTRSIGCYCVDENGEEHHFHSIKDATVWWFDNYKPFGDRYVLVTLQRKIRKDFIAGEGYNGLRWHKEISECVETIERVSEN